MNHILVPLSTQSSGPLNMDILRGDPIPLFIVEGFCGGSGSVFWRDFVDSLNQCYRGSDQCRRAMFVKVGPVSSLHDRACELFYAIKGGTVDYGEDHSKSHRHSRYARTHVEGLYPWWSPKRPLHFLGHSMGGSTIVKLQDLIRQGFFGPEYHPDMLLSVNTISAPFRGSQIVYVLGERPDCVPSVRQFSVGSMVAKGVHLISYLDPIMPPLLDFHSESRRISYKDCPFGSLLKHLWRSDWTEGEDATPYDVTFQAMDKREANGEGIVNEQTFYTSYVSCMTTQKPDGTHAPDALHLTTLPLYITSRSIGSFDFNSLQPLPSFCSPKPNQDMDLEPAPISRNQDDYLANDGVVPVFSQWHPLPCSQTRCIHHQSTMSGAQLTSGVWNVFPLDGANHLSIVPFWVGSSQQKIFFEDLGERLCQIEKQWKMLKDIPPSL